MMPSKESDARCTNKKLHIGNNYVTIVYNESGEPYSLGTIKVGTGHMMLVLSAIMNIQWLKAILYVLQLTFVEVPELEPSLSSVEKMFYFTFFLSEHVRCS